MSDFGFLNRFIVLPVSRRARVTILQNRFGDLQGQHLDQGAEPLKQSLKTKEPSCCIVVVIDDEHLSGKNMNSYKAVPLRVLP